MEKELLGSAFRRYADAEAETDEVRRAAEHLRQEIEDLIVRARRIRIDARPSRRSGVEGAERRP